MADFDRRSHPLADPIALAELEFRILLLPPISRAAHLDGPDLHARQLVALWKVDDSDDVSIARSRIALDLPCRFKISTGAINHASSPLSRYWG